jgi:protein-S-isoprenylcysteine O-methyltransferase Ste14
MRLGRPVLQCRRLHQEANVRKVALAVIVVLLAAAALLVMTHYSRAQALYVGAALVIVGLPLLVLARVQLGKSFSIGPKAKALVTHGLYSKIPHPMFTFLDVALLGVVIALGRPWLVGAWLALVAVHALASRREARVLEKAFGDAYREYRARTWW